jgi:hypothetical protein
MGSGISSGVSRQAKPNIMPWSPAPWSWLSPAATARLEGVVTPPLMSGDCSWTLTVPQVR